VGWLFWLVALLLSLCFGGHKVLSGGGNKRFCPQKQVVQAAVGGVLPLGGFLDRVTPNSRFRWLLPLCLGVRALGRIKRTRLDIGMEGTWWKWES